MMQKCKNCDFACTGLLNKFCCRKCKKSAGEHGSKCEQAAYDAAEEVKCENCDFLVTKSVKRLGNFCCWQCKGQPHRHGPYCKRCPVTAPVVEPPAVEPPMAKPPTDGLGAADAAKDTDAIVPPPEKKTRTGDASVDLATGQELGSVKILFEREPPFGFVAPHNDGPDLYFNEGLLGGRMTWAEFKQMVREYPPGKAQVVYTLTEAFGRPRASDVVILNRDDLKDIDEDADDEVDPEELAIFLEKHPDLKEASRTKQRREYERGGVDYEKLNAEAEEESRHRDELFQRQDAEEDALYKKRDELNDEAQRLWAEADSCWDWGEHEKAKELQAKAKELQVQARDIKAQAVELDWKHNEEMFEYVQTKEHEGRERDGTWVDLHGLSMDFAKHATLEALASAKERGLKKVEVITGAGNHSGKGGPLIRPMVCSFLKHPPASLRPLTFADEGNPGAYTVWLS
mmetsp:Transcript_6249/g.15514  ORF Transcript_6249/g.15514 Transcript_6249/m.15514 type:complete len:457 (-) Transcript_6249:102-1472(-)|eukprot:CAMPEP_0117504852 /NCGR_PEP_ID=MMETSP0784-20121206/25065_1 /TAXON_ID=39447 /ORGANISM="" /LENGTH=456 /DNA_ID=CAMNT_0005300225 /DNA_START=98 /DNA_END=1468 /DNA_ORIENTATION=-